VQGGPAPANESAICTIEDASRGSRGLSRILDRTALIGMASNCSSQTTKDPCPLGSLGVSNIFSWWRSNICEMPLRGTLQDHIAYSLENVTYLMRLTGTGLCKTSKTLLLAASCRKSHPAIRPPWVDALLMHRKDCVLSTS
jgi:hypothetical protein